MRRIAELLWEYVLTATDRTGRLITLATVVVGVVAGVILSGAIRVQADPTANLLSLVLVGGSVAFLIDLVFVAPTRLLLRIRRPRAAVPMVINNYYGTISPTVGGVEPAPPYQAEPNYVGRLPWMDDDLIEDRIVRLVDLPMIRNTIRGKTLRRCTVFGPAVMIPMGNGELSNCAFEGSASSLLWEIDESNRPEVMGAVAVVDCRFLSCRFVGIGIAGPRVLVDRFRGMPER